MNTSRTGSDLLNETVGSDVGAYYVIFGFTVFSIFHVRFDRRVSLHLLRARGIERSREEYDYPFELPRFDWAPQKWTVGNMACFLVREILFGWIRIIVFLIGLVLVSLNNCELGQTRFFSVLQLLISLLSVVFVSMINVSFSTAHKQAIWANLTCKRDLLAKRGVHIPKRFSFRLTLLTNVVRSCCYLQFYQTFSSVMYILLWQRNFDRCPNTQHMVTIGLFLYQIISMPVFLFYMWAYVWTYLKCFFKSRVPPKMIHTFLFYYPSELKRTKQQELFYGEGDSLQILEDEEDTKSSKLVLPGLDSLMSPASLDYSKYSPNGTNGRLDHLVTSRDDDDVQGAQLTSFSRDDSNLDFESSLHFNHDTKEEDDHAPPPPKLLNIT